MQVELVQTVHYKTDSLHLCLFFYDSFSCLCMHAARLKREANFRNEHCSRPLYELVCTAAEAYLTISRNVFVMKMVSWASYYTLPRGQATGARHVIQGLRVLLSIQLRSRPSLTNLLC
jgi:hypothetical protein